ncbi:hypothetical protein CAC02_10880 [Streptococcus gallolyticus]|uniref:ABC-2 type transporter transmembrane domain-containing protein n=1 Tax=Streptococcus gallolyticus TaxID=315405 RepID=A0A368UC02_9STRE|nr:ABC transporter permease [Streptococcus gallolyticus]RCW15889.1 hypothetical protein CAC02_10880 [Streptococcus gallolyticus]
MIRTLKPFFKMEICALSREYVSLFFMIVLPMVLTVVFFLVAYFDTMFIFFILGYGLALLIKSSRMASLVSSGIFMFLLFTSGVALPVESLPIIVQKVAHVFPMYHAIQVIQTLWINEFTWADNGINCLYLLFYSVIALFLLLKVKIRWD